MWCPAVGWVLGRVEAGFGSCWRVVDAGLVGGASGPGLGRQPEGAGSARRASSTVLKALAQGQRAGSRSRAWCRHSGQSRRCAVSGEPGPAHDQASLFDAAFLAASADGEGGIKRAQDR